MEYTYTEITNEFGKFIQRSDGACIPLDPANADYERYLNPEAEQSTPSLTDEATAE
jgi:hypothetical protein